MSKMEKSMTHRKTVKLRVIAIAALATKSTIVRVFASRSVTYFEGIGLLGSLIMSIFASQISFKAYIANDERVIANASANDISIGSFHADTKRLPIKVQKPYYKVDFELLKTFVSST